MAAAGAAVAVSVAVLDAVDDVEAVGDADGVRDDADAVEDKVDANDDETGIDGLTVCDAFGTSTPHRIALEQPSLSVSVRVRLRGSIGRAIRYERQRGTRPGL